MHIPTLIRRITLPVGALLLITACAGGTSAGWTYAPLGPSPNASAAASTAPGTPSGSGGPGTTLTLETTQDQPITFNPTTMAVTPGATVTVNYMNNSNLPHNIDFFNGPDSSSPSLAKTDVGTGPNNAQTLTFTAPTTPGDYLYWCDVHTTAMQGTLHVQ